jgi:hypothetical protein
MPQAPRIKIIMKRNLNVGIDEIRSSSLVLNYFSNAESGIESNVIIMKTIIVIVPQKNEMSNASFLLIS